MLAHQEVHNNGQQQETELTTIESIQTPHQVQVAVLKIDLY